MNNPTNTLELSVTIDQMVASGLPSVALPAMGFSTAGAAAMTGAGLSETVVEFPAMTSAWYRLPAVASRSWKQLHKAPTANHTDIYGRPPGPSDRTST